MGGTIDVESSFGKGSTFTVRLPLIKGDKSRLESELHINEIVYAKNREDVRALVVDDMPVNLLVFSGFLEKHNIVPDTAASGREAVEAVKNNKYDIIFMDHMMSDMDGIEAAKQIRSLEGKYHKIIPIIAVSANATADYKQLFLKSGMNDFLSKPVNAIGLNDILCKWLAPEKLKHGDRRRTERRQSVLRKEKSGRRAGELSNKDEAIFERLSKIEGLDTDAGLKHSDGKIKSYIAVLQQFCDNFEESSNCIKNSKEKKDWKDYAIRVHAYKGVFAIIGHAALFAWSRKLEYAAKMLDGALDKIKTSVETEKNLLPDDLDNALAICEEECDAYLGSIRALRNRLVKSALGYIQNEKKGKISRGDLAVLLKALAESSRGYKTKEAEKIVRTLKRCSVNAEIDIEIAKIIRLVRNFDYEAAVAKIQKLGS
jgi:CheY-like chemotaxis protein